MANFSPRVLRLLSNEMTDTPLRHIDALFDDYGIELGLPQPLENDQSERRERMRRYLSTLNLETSVDAMKLASVLTEVLQKIMQEGSQSWDTETAKRDKWIRILRGEGFEIDEATGLVRIPSTTGAKLTDHALNALEDPQSIQDHLQRLGSTVDTDPRLAVSTAKALIESTAKCVLTARGQEYSRAAKIPKLVTAAQESLGLAPKSAGKEDAALRQALQSLITLTQSVTEIRNRVGVDHGAEEVPTWVRPRHARVVVGAAQVWCQLMLETLSDPSAPWRHTEP